MRVLFIGDPHLKITRFDLAKQFLDWINKVIIEQKPDLVVNLGDTFDTHAVIRSEVLTEFMKHVDMTIKVCPYVYLLGNHDMYKPNDAKYHAMSHLKGKIKDFIVVDEVIDLYDMTFVPYIHNPNNFPTKTLPICIAHQTFKGADYGDITTKDGVNASSIAGVEIFISGHIHKRQRINYDSVASSAGQVVYIGTPFSQNASDINQIKGVSIIDTNTYAEEFIVSPMPKWQGLKYEISSTFTADEMHEELMQTLNDKDHWVVEITGPKAEVIGYIGSKKGKSLTVNRDVKIKTIFTDKDKRQLRIEAVSLSSIVSEYIDKVYNGSIDKDLLKSTAGDILKSLDNSSPLV